MTEHLPPGWPEAVLPPGTREWEQSASSWLLDQCPADFRAYPVLRKQVLGLAWLAYQHVGAQRQALDRGLSRIRTDLSRDLPPAALEEMIEAVQQEQSRLAAAQRGVELVARALRGERYIPRL
ncbi:hypothetical protein LWF15_17715 [Kineosporia rhizophila]|uniref:hypothetical protein n=1 Tax=Kineosporia TaxID=49184 RepID=UPI001E4CBDD0|nr:MULTISPECIES: hypothetical protein [Kineosporia]MCE0537343.1 hypothetical protein [Kineosporia rhizophila]GLY17511.1 hypothetical protein Kisp01_45250 [Kineosporia sp. NBRC 101677]